MHSADPLPPSFDDLHAEAVSLAERARAYFEDEGVRDRGSLDELHRVAFSLQRLRISTRLLAVFGSLADARGPLRAVGPERQDEPAFRDTSGSMSWPTGMSVADLPARMRTLSEESRSLERLVAERLGTVRVGTVAELRRLIERALGSGKP